ncbi:hypothetical protein ALO99_200036 [Pseudomonas coronafaciens pv. porri]|nr:hypothetical protein ALO99_200036 [Pseudomonas coronafaciens pv. porri]
MFCEILILLFDTTSLNMINSKFSVKLVRYKVTPCEVWGENYLWIIFSGFNGYVHKLTLWYPIGLNR